MSGYYWITDKMRKAGLYGPYLDMVGPWGTRKLRDQMKARAERRAQQILNGSQEGAASEEVKDNA